jgi:hypothetical protein
MTLRVLVACEFIGIVRDAFSPLFKALCRLYPEAGEYLRNMRSMEFGRGIS